MRTSTSNASSRIPRGRSARHGFTLAEVLAALLFLAVVIPVVVQGLQVASQAGQSGLREATAYRVADRALNEYLVLTSAGLPAVNAGTTLEGAHEFQWSIETTNWKLDSSMRTATAVVRYTLQDREYDIRLSTLDGSTY